MKSFLILAALALSLSSLSSFASDDIRCSANPSEGIGIDLDYVVQEIQSSGSCYQAGQIAVSCAFGGYLDTFVAGSAAEVCDQETGTLSESDAALKQVMLDRCDRVCDPRTNGTLCYTTRAFCRLSVSKFLNEVNAAGN